MVNILIERIKRQWNHDASWVPRVMLHAVAVSGPNLLPDNTRSGLAIDPTAPVHPRRLRALGMEPGAEGRRGRGRPGRGRGRGRPSALERVEREAQEELAAEAAAAAAQPPPPRRRGRPPSAAPKAKAAPPLPRVPDAVFQTLLGHLPATATHPLGPILYEYAKTCSSDERFGREVDAVAQGRSLWAQKQAPGVASAALATRAAMAKQHPKKTRDFLRRNAAAGDLAERQEHFQKQARNGMITVLFRDHTRS